MTDIFISYSKTDKNIANQICAKLEDARLKCWIAPRDITVGESYATGIIRGIDNCKCMVVVFSAAANNSQHVIREVERAVSKGICIIPFKIDDVLPTAEMDYFLRVPHWLDAFDMRLEDAIETLTENIAQLINQPIGSPINIKAETKPTRSKGKAWRNAIMVLLLIGAGLGVYSYQMQNNIPVTIQEKTDSSFVTQPLNTNNYAIEQTDKPQNKTLKAKQQYLQNQLDTKRKLQTLRDYYLQQSDSQLADSLMALINISASLPNHNAYIHSWLVPKKEDYQNGDRVKFKTQLQNTSAYVLAVLHLPDGTSYLIHPSREQVDIVNKGESLFIGNDSDFELEIGELSKGNVMQFIAVTNKQQFQRLLQLKQPIDGMDIAIIDRSELSTELQALKKEGKGALKSSWGESSVLINAAQ